MIGLVDPDRADQRKQKGADKEDHCSIPVSPVIKVYVRPSLVCDHPGPLSFTPFDEHSGGNNEKTENEENGEHEIDQNADIGIDLFGKDRQDEEKKNNQSREPGDESADSAQPVVDQPVRFSFFHSNTRIPELRRFASRLEDRKDESA